MRRGAPSASEPLHDACADGLGGLGRPCGELLGPGTGIATTRSKRSSNARTPCRGAAMRAGGHTHSSRGSPHPPQGHRFIVATRRKRAGRRPPTDPGDRDDAVLSGCRRASSTGRGNSGNSSSSSTPRWARLTSPGRGTVPPPITGAPPTPRGEGARNGGARRPPPGARSRQPSGCAWDLERLLARERPRQNRGEPASQHRLRSRADRRGGGCASRRSQLERAAAAFLPAHSGGGRRRRRRVVGRLRRPDLVVPLEVPHGLGEVVLTPTASMPASAASCDDSAAQRTLENPATCRALRGGDRARDRPDSLPSSPAGHLRGCARPGDAGRRRCLPGAQPLAAHHRRPLVRGEHLPRLPRFVTSPDWWSWRSRAC